MVQVGVIRGCLPSLWIYMDTGRWVPGAIPVSYPVVSYTRAIDQPGPPGNPPYEMHL
jgi:hypothetical protein